ncbi:MAG: sigma-70 family RNA polymerase sigma factor [Aquimonas sp.]|nr:sigma-70 family RNA polymerase sigma factor [Aquimonas sp.]
MDSTAHQHTTAWLLDRARDGDRSARQQLVHRVEPLLRRFAHGRVPQLLRHREDTADLVQLTWLKVLNKLDGIDAREPGAFFAYLRAVLINALRESLRREAGTPVAAGGELAEKAEAVVPAESVDITDWLAYEQALQRLAAEHRGLVLMRFEFGMSFAEIAAETGETPDGVRMKLNRAIARMAQAEA